MVKVTWIKRVKEFVGIGALSLVILSGSIFSSGTSVSAKELTNKEKEINTVEDLNLEAGMVDKEKLPADFRKKLDNRIKELNKYFEDLAQAKVKYEYELNKNENKPSALDLMLLDETKNKYTDLYNNSESIASLTRMPDAEAEDSVISTLSTIENVTVAKPTLWYDNLLRMYVMNGSWKWTSTSSTDDEPGGDDGFGLKAVQRKVSVLDDSIGTYNGFGDSTTHSYSYDASSYGLGFRFQDKNSSYMYSGYSGNAWMYFTWYGGTPVGYTVNYRTVYAHSYNTTSLNSFSIGADSFGLSWTSTSNRWSKENYNAVSY